MATTATSYEELLKENEELKAQIETAQQNQTKYQQGTTPTKYVSPYAAELEKLSGELKGSTFSYSKEEDPNWQSMRKQYLLAADRTNKDVMAQASAPTGGRASSYAVTAASQAANDMRASLTEQERALYDAAFDRYYQEYSKQLQDYANLVEQDNTNYDRWLQEETNAQELKEQKYDKLVTLIASTGYSPTEEELTAAGMSAGEAASWKSYYQQQLALSSASSGGSGSGGSGGGSSGSRSSGTSGSTSGSGKTSGASATPTIATETWIKNQASGNYGGLQTGTTGLKGVDYDYLAGKGSSSSGTSSLNTSQINSILAGYKKEIGTQKSDAVFNAYLKNKIVYSSYTSAQKNQLLKAAGLM